LEVAVPGKGVATAGPAVELPGEQSPSGDAAAYLSLLRRVPRQQRGRDKVARILDAAEELLIEIGYDRVVASPALLIARAHVSGGSFYTYFASPEGAMEALALRFMEEVKVTADALAGGIHVDWQDAASTFFDTFVGFYEQAAVRELWLEGHLSRVGRQADDDTNAHLGRCLEAMLVAATEPIGTFDAIRYRVAIEIYDYLMRLAFRADGQARRQLLREAKHAFLVYLGSPTPG
jgi:AcrR family transcriptional regulator